MLQPISLEIALLFYIVFEDILFYDYLVTKTQLQLEILIQFPQHHKDNHLLHTVTIEIDHFLVDTHQI